MLGQWRRNRSTTAIGYPGSSHTLNSPRLWSSPGRMSVDWKKWVYINLSKAHFFFLNKCFYLCMWEFCCSNNPDASERVRWWRKYTCSLEIHSSGTSASITGPCCPGLDQRDPCLFLARLRQAGKMFSKDLSTTTWHLPSTSTRLQSCAATAADLHHPPEDAQGGDQKPDALCWGGGGGSRGATGRTGLQRGIFSSCFYEPSSCISSYLEKH